MLCALITGWSRSRLGFPLFYHSQADPWKESLTSSSSLRVQPTEGRALLWLARYESKGSFTNQAESFWNKAWAKACFYSSCSESVCRRKDGWRSTEAVHHSECGWIMDTVLHSQPFANPCSNATFPGCAERFNGTNPRGLFLFIHLKPCFELLQTGHCPSQHTKHCTGAHTFHSAWQTSWTQSLIYIWS